MDPAESFRKAQPLLLEKTKVVLNDNSKASSSVNFVNALLL